MAIHPTEEKPANAATANLPDTTDKPPAPAPAEAPPTASPSKLGVPCAINLAAIAARRLASMPSRSSNPPAMDIVGGQSMSVDENREREKEARRDRSERRDKGEKSSRGRVLADYVLTKTLGAGSMGKVKLAVHTRMG